MYQTIREKLELEVSPLNIHVENMKLVVMLHHTSCSRFIQ